MTVTGLSKRFGGIVALDGVSFSVKSGEIVGLIGPNGAGKTTVFNCISRFYTPEAGEIRFGDVDVLRLAPNGLTGVGVGRTFQQAELFKTMTVEDNLLIGLHNRAGRMNRLPTSPRSSRASKTARIVTPSARSSSSSPSAS